MDDDNNGGWTPQDILAMAMFADQAALQWYATATRQPMPAGGLSVATPGGQFSAQAGSGTLLTVVALAVVVYLILKR